MNFAGRIATAIVIGCSAAPAAFAGCADELPALEQRLTAVEAESNPALADAMLAFERATALCASGDEAAARTLIDQSWAVLTGGQS